MVIVHWTLGPLRNLIGGAISDYLKRHQLVWRNIAAPPAPNVYLPTAGRNHFSRWEIRPDVTDVRYD